MGKLSRRMDKLKSRGGRAPDQRKGTAGKGAQRQPIPDDTAWGVGPPPPPKPPSPLQNAMFLVFAAVLIVVLNAIFWGRGGDAPTIDPVTGRQLNQPEAWD